MPAVPDATGRGAEIAIAALRRTRWVYRLRAVREDIDETAVLPDGRVNEVVDQEPAHGELAPKPMGVTLDVVAPPPAARIDGIGPTYAEELSGAGLDTISELALADPGIIQTLTGVSPSRAQAWLRTAKGYAAAYRLTRYETIGSREAEAFYEALGWTSPSDLEGVDHDELLDELDQAVLDDELDEKFRDRLVALDWSELQASLEQRAEA